MHGGRIKLVLARLWGEPVVRDFGGRGQVESDGFELLDSLLKCVDLEVDVAGPFQF